MSSLSDMVFLTHESSPSVCRVIHGEIIEIFSFFNVLGEPIHDRILFDPCIMSPKNNLPNTAQHAQCKNNS